MPLKASKEKQTALDYIEANEKTITKMSDTIWGYAEPALREYRSSRLLCEYLRKNGFDVEMGISGIPTAFVATYGSGKPVIATYAEYDATPGNSQKPVPFREPVVPHAPGFEDKHNMLGVAATSGIVAAKEAMDRHRLKGTLKIFGTPAEKICVAKAFQARDGFYNDLDAVIANHPMNFNTVTWDHLPGCYMATAFQFHGLQSYGGRPWAGKSALDGVIIMNVLANFMKEQILPHDEYPSLNEIVSVGGQCLTNIPEFAEVFYAMRSPTIPGTKKIFEILKKCAEAAATAVDLRLNMRVMGASRTGLPNHALSELVYRNMEMIGPPRFSEEEKEFCREIQRSLGVEPMKEPLDETLTKPWELGEWFKGGCDDFNEFTWYAPSAWLHTTMWFRSHAGFDIPSWAIAATSKTGITHKGGIFAAKAIATSMIELLIDQKQLKKAKSEFKKRTEGGIEECLIPKDEKPPIDLALPEFNGKETVIRYPTTGHKPLYRT
jgi:aminobenzoyl-glutamate utilization protein B